MNWRKVGVGSNDQGQDSADSQKFLSAVFWDSKGVAYYCLLLDDTKVAYNEQCLQQI